MRPSITALLIGLLSSAGLPAFAQVSTPVVPVASSPVQFLGADIGTVGKISISGVGTATARNSVGSSNNLSLGTNSILSIGSSLETSPEYEGLSQVSAVLDDATWHQTIGVTSAMGQAEIDNTIVDNSGVFNDISVQDQAISMITGSFTGDFHTTSGRNNDSDVSLNGLSNTTSLNLASSSMNTQTSLRDDADIDSSQNGIANANATVGLITTAAANVSAHDMSSSFIQVFTTADSFKGIEAVVDPADLVSDPESFENF